MKIFCFDVSGKIFHGVEQPTTLAHCCLTTSNATLPGEKKNSFV